MKSNRKKVNLKTTHGGSFSDYLTSNQIIKLYNLLQLGGQKRINNKWYEINSSSMILYKAKKYIGANYIFDLNSTKKIT